MCFNVIELLRTRYWSDSPPPIQPLLPLSLSTSPPVSYSSLRIVFLPPSLHRSSVLYASSCVVIPLPPSLSVLNSSLYWASPPSPLFLSLTEREIININVSLLLLSLFPLPLFFVSYPFTTDLFSALPSLFIPLSGSLSLIIAFTQPSLHLSPSLPLSSPPPPSLFPSFLRPRLSAAVQYSSITVVLIIPFSACSHTVIYQINNPSLLLLLCLPLSPSLSFLTVPSEGYSACQMSLRVKVPSLQPSPLIPVSRLLDALIKVTQV